MTIEENERVVKFLENWGLTPEENTARMEQVKSGELIPIWVGSDTGYRELIPCPHEKKYHVGGEWTQHCEVCDLGLAGLKTLPVFPGKRIELYVQKTAALDAIAEAEKKILARNAEKEAKKQNDLAAEQALFAKAKQTGEKQLLRKYTQSCDEEDCSLDEIMVFAMPDGTRKISRIHTY